MVAAQCGFGSAESMRKAFMRRLRVAPSVYRSRFSARVAAGYVRHLPVRVSERRARVTGA